MSRTTANFLMLFAGLVWGAGFIAQETAMDDIGPFLFMTLRFPLAALAITPLLVIEHKRYGAVYPLSRKDWPTILVVGIIFFIAMSLQQVGLIATSVTNAGMLTGLYVVLVPMLSYMLYQEKQPVMIWLCAAAAFAGIWLLGGGSLNALTWGDWLVIIGALFAALHVIAMGKAATGLRRPVVIACAQFAVSGVLALICFCISQLIAWQYEPAFNVQTVIAAGPEILYAALFAGALAFTIMAVCQQYTSAANAAILLSSETLFAALAGAIFLSERLSLIGYAGCGLLFTAIAVTSFIAGKREDEEAPATS